MKPLRVKLTNALAWLIDKWIRIPKGRIAVIICALGLYFVIAGNYVPVLAWLTIAMISTGFLVWLLIFRFQRFLVSAAYQYILASKIVAFILTTAGFYLTLWPLPARIAVISRLWFSLLALVFILSDIGYYLYSRDVKAVVELDRTQDQLPVVPPTPEESAKAETEKNVPAGGE